MILKIFSIEILRSLPKIWLQALKIFSIEILRPLPKIWLQTQAVRVCFFTAVFSTELMSFSLL